MLVKKECQNKLQKSFCNHLFALFFSVDDNVSIFVRHVHVALNQSIIELKMLLKIVCSVVTTSQSLPVMFYHETSVENSTMIVYLFWEILQVVVLFVVLEKSLKHEDQY